VEVARRRQATYEDFQRGRNVKDDVRVKYSVTDLDVLNFTDEVKRKLANRASFHIGAGYGAAGTQATLGALAAAATTFGWGVTTASGLGLGATYVFGMAHIFDPKGHAQAYEEASTAIQAAEASYYFHQLGMGFSSGEGRKIVDLSLAHSRSDIPSDSVLSPDGETLYYRVTKILKVLNDVLASKIPDLQDLKDAKGDSSGSIASPAKPGDAPASKTTSTTPKLTPAPKPNPLPSVTHTPSPIADDDVSALRSWWKPGGAVNVEHAAQFNAWLNTNEGGIDIASFLNNPLYKNDWPKARAALVPQH
jgi:hypothetical protein